MMILNYIYSFILFVSNQLKRVLNYSKHIKSQIKYNSFYLEKLKFPKDDQESYLYTQIQSGNYFDADWYILVYQKQIEYHQDLLLDYIRAGIQNGRDPSPYFNTILYQREQDVPPEQAVVHFLHSGRQVASGAYRDEMALLNTQKAFQSKTETCLVEDRRTKAKPFAVYLQCGAGAIHGSWWEDETRPFHLVVNHYDSTYAGKIPADVEFRQAGVLPGTKFTSFHSVLENYPHLLSPYEYVLLLDDDIIFDEGGIGLLFSIVQQHGWEMAQASLSSESHCSYPVFYHTGKGGWRRVNGVEIMMPVFSKRLLPDIRNLIGQSISGWGFDAALSVVAGKMGYQAIVVDDVIARHEKPINADIGGYYQMLHRADIYPEIEFTHLQKKYGYTKPLFYEI